MRTHAASGTIAKNRLEAMLLADKLQADTRLMAQLRRELGAVLRKYMDTDQVRMDLLIRLTKETRQGAGNVKTIQIKGL